MSNLSSAKFTEVYDALPQDAQRALVHKHLIPLLDQTKLPISKKAISAANRLHKRYQGIPTLDLKAKKIEINGLLDDLMTDSKRSFVKEKSNKDALVQEVIDSLTDWLSDIWSVVYEFKINFALAHSCLLFITSVLEDIATSHDTCKCAYTTQFISLQIKSHHTRKTIKSFHLSGANKLDQVLLWIWRELFVSLLGTSDSHGVGERGKGGNQKGLVMEMLGDIERAKNWRALERILYGGKFSLDSDDEEDEDSDSDSDSDSGSDDEYEDSNSCSNSSDSSSAYSDEDFDWSICPCNFHAKHWSPHINRQRIPLRHLIHTHLLSHFSLSPSPQLYETLLLLTITPSATLSQIRGILSSIATSSSDTFAATIDIHSLDLNAPAISTLLKSHYHLLRPKDAQVLQTATTILSEYPPSYPQSLTILEKEMMDTVKHLRSALLPLFSHMEEEANKLEIGQIAKLRPGSAQRQDRVERWVDAVISPGTNNNNNNNNNAPHPMAFAAFMMGLPVGPGLDDMDDVDPLGYLDQGDEDGAGGVDPDLEDLREELRPRLKERFDGWMEVALVMKGGGAAVLNRVYCQIVLLMPFFRVHDAVEEIIARLAQKPSKHHICDALDSIGAFCKLQRKKFVLKSDKKKKAAATATATPAASTSTSISNSTPLGRPIGSFPMGMGGLEDVD